jgi:hypothetical protein
MLGDLFNKTHVGALERGGIPPLNPEVFLFNKRDFKACFFHDFPPCCLRWRFVFFDMPTRREPLLQFRMKKEKDPLFMQDVN